MLLIVRSEGRSLYIGRDIVVTVASVLGERDDRVVEFVVNHPANIAVSPPGTPMTTHVEAQYLAERRPASSGAARTSCFCRRAQAVSIGRGVTVVVSGFESGGDVRLGIEAPRHMAVSRDDFTLEEHLAFQVRREQGRLG